MRLISVVILPVFLFTLGCMGSDTPTATAPDAAAPAEAAPEVEEEAAEEEAAEEEAAEEEAAEEGAAEEENPEGANEADTPKKSPKPKPEVKKMTRPGSSGSMTRPTWT